MKSLVLTLWSLLTGRRAEREIFAFWDGQRTRQVDPLVAWRALWAHPTIDLHGDIKVVANPKMADGTRPYTDAEVYEAEDRIRALIREVFGVKAFSEDVAGLTVVETDELLDQFWRYIAAIKKKRKPLPMTPPASVSMQPQPSTDTENSPMSSPSDSGSTANESSDGEPSGSALPSSEQ